MARISTQQPALKPQDLFVLFALLSHEKGAASYPELASHTGLASSAVHTALKRAAVAGLVAYRDRRPYVLKPQLREFVISGARYAFPAVHGADPPPVWPHIQGSVRGIALAPLYPTVPAAALKDEKLYALLALFDALRAGQAREREIAKQMLAEAI